MRKIYFLLFILFSIASFEARSQVVVSQIYGGGGNSGATYKNDFIELFNAGNSSVSVAGWSVQYASTTGTGWSKTDLSGTIPAHGYYLIQESAGTGGTTALPAPDATGSIAIAAGAGKVALLNTNILISSGISCPSGISLIDLVGFGNSTNCFKGSGPTPSPGNTTSVLRINNGCTDTNNNSSDFSTGTPTPRNTSSLINTCVVACTPPANQPTALNLSSTSQSINGNFTAAIGADNYLVLISTSNSLNQLPTSGTSYTPGATLGNAQVVSVNGTTFTATSLLSSTTYNFFIFSYNNTGKCFNINSPLKGVITTSASAVASFIISPPADFGNVCINTSASPNSFTIDGNNLNGTNIAIATISGFTFAESLAGPYSSTLSFSYTGNSFTAKQVYVKFFPAAVQSYNNNIIVSGGGVSSYTIPVTGSGINTAPTVTANSASGITSNAAILQGIISSNGCTAITAYGIEYSTVSGFTNGSGTQVSATNLIGGAFSINLTGLAANTIYFYKGFAVNSSGTSYSSQQSFATTAIPVVMNDLPFLSFTEGFDDVATWTNNFTSGNGASHFSSVPIGGSTTIPNASKITVSTSSFATGTSPGVQKGNENIILLTTGGTNAENSSSAAIDFYMDFTNVNAGTLSFDWASVNNSTGNRNGSLRVYASVNGTSFTELTDADVLNFTNNVLTSGSVVNVQLPASFNNNPNARIRFYYHNGTGDNANQTLSRPKISIDNLTVTAVSNTPCVTPVSQPTNLVFGNITDVSIEGSFTAASPSPNEYLVVMSSNSSLTSLPVDGQVYNLGDNIGDGAVVSKGRSLSFTATQLSGSTAYYFFIFPVNSVCLDGPKYSSDNLLTGSATTAAGIPPCASPADQPSGLSLNAVSSNTIHGAFTPNTANEFLVLRSTSASLTASPLAGQVYNSGDVIGNATVIQRSAAASFNASGLAPNTAYYFYVISLNSQGCINGPAYNTSTPLAASVSTLPLPACSTPAAQPTNLSFNTTNNSIAGTFNASGTDYNYLVIMSTQSSLSAFPVDNSDYNPGTGLGGGTVIANSAATSFTAGSLLNSTTYYFFVFSANKNCSGGTKYLSLSPLTGNTTTTNAPANNYYFGTLHSHSDYSDGNKDHPGFKPTDDYNYALGSQGMDFLGISEHNHFSSPDNPGNLIANYHSGITEAKNFTAAHPGFLALYGMEWGVISGGGHVVVYGDNMDKLFGWESNVGGTTGPNYDVFVPKSVYTGPTGLFKSVNDYVGKNTFATLAHPNNTDYNNLSNSAYDAVADSAIVGTAVESGPATSTNTSYSNPPSSMAYLWYYQKMLSRGYHLGPVIDHDNHNTTFGRTTYARTAVIAPALTQSDLVKAIRDMHFYATEDVDAKVDFNINSRMMGSVFTDRNAPAISVSLTDATTNTSNAVIRIMFGVPGSGILPVKVDSVIGNSLQFVDNNLPVNSTGYYYADILNGNIHIVTSPVWYTRICSIANDITVSACSNYTWNGTTYTASTTASATFRTDGGCDSTVTLHLTIKQPTTGDTTAVACDRFTWYGNTYTSSATATHVFTNAAGCDSTVTLHLTINTSPSVAITAAGPTSVCPGSGVNLTTEADAGSGSIDTYQWLLKGNPLTGGLPSFTATSTGNYSVKITNSNSCFAVSNAISVTVEDHVLPVPNVAELPDVTGECSATATTPAATDNCAGIITGTTTDPLSYNSQGTHTITWIFDDHNGNVTTQNQRVIVHDATAPVITVPVAINKNTDPGVCNAVVNFSATATDNCNGPVTINYSQAPGTAFPEGVTTIVVTAKDENGNSSSSGFTITITDNQPPLVTAIPVVNTCNSTSGTYTIPAATATDNCGMDSVSYVITGATSRSGSGYNASGGFNTGTSTIVWTVTDIHGNISTASTTVNVNAALNASIVVNPVYTVAPGGSAYTIYLGYGPQTVSLKATATGGTAPYTYTWNTVSSLSSFNTASTNASPVTTTTYTVTITDAAGCQASITQTIQVVDVRSGNKNDKVTICHSGHEISVSSNAVPAQLKNGGYLGNCTINNSARGNSPAPVNSMNKLSIRVDEKTSSSLNVSVKPNPSISVFMVHVETSSPDPVTIRITDESGRLREMKKNITGRNDVMIGGNLKGGTYFIEVEQGTKKQTVKVIKLN